VAAAAADVTLASLVIKIRKIKRAAKAVCWRQYDFLHFSMRKTKPIRRNE
jgi:hypothetical protein